MFMCISWGRFNLVFMVLNGQCRLRSLACRESRGTRTKTSSTMWEEGSSCVRLAVRATLLDGGDAPQSEPCDAFPQHGLNAH